jgi:hypothetical protein
LQDHSGVTKIWIFGLKIYHLATLAGTKNLTRLHRSIHAGDQLYLYLAVSMYECIYVFMFVYMYVHTHSIRTRAYNVGALSIFKCKPNGLCNDA